MLDREKTQKIILLSMEFQKAVEAHMMNDATVRSALGLFATEEDEQKTDALNERYNAEYERMKDLGSVTEEFLGVCMEMADVITEIAQRVMQDETIAECAPAGLCQKDVMDALKEHKAQHVLKICRHKISMG